jgi:UDP-glucose 4-epimerase
LILVIGGLNGFVGSNTTEALVELGHDCVVTSHQNSDAPAFLEKRMGHGVAVEHADATSVDDLRSLGEKHEIDGILNVAGGFAPSTGWPVPLIGGYFEMLSATLRVAAEWKVSRLLFSSTGGVYFGTGAGPSR